MDRQPLKLGVAYHGNRMHRHAAEDFLDIANHGFDTVVHMLSHIDWTRHLETIKDFVKMSEDFGLESWMDNWGLAGAPGDTSFFLALYPNDHAVFSDGTLSDKRVCLNSPNFREFTKQWIDAVVYTGAKKIFWDEPALPTKKGEGDKRYYSCTCPRCRKLFEEKYGRPMPLYSDDDVKEFQADSVADYFREVTEYAHNKGLENSVCVMLSSYGMNIDSASKVAMLPYMDDIGSDPYWVGKKAKNPDLDVYEFVYNGTKKNLAISNEYSKKHNLWIQTYNNPIGSEEEIVEATEAAYDAGARTILAWGYYGSESNDYRAKNPVVTWKKTCDAFARIREMERDAILAEKRQKFLK